MSSSKALASIAVPATTQMETTWSEKEKGKLAGNDVPASLDEEGDLHPINPNFKMYKEP